MDMRKVMAKNRAIPAVLHRLGISGSPRQHPEDEAPLRSELFSADQMEQYGKTLAQTHTTTSQGASDQLLSRLAQNEEVLLDACLLLTEAVKANHRIVPAGEWLLDNFYLIEDQIRTAKKHLPKGYSRELPRLAQGTPAGLPRVYDIAQQVIAHGDGRLDPDSLSRFVAAYQTVAALKLGELWAIPIMLRLALIENLRRVAARVAAARGYRIQAENWANRMMEVAEKDPKNLILVIADMARSKPPLVSPFVAELARRLQGQGPFLALPLTWIEQRLSESSLTIEHLVQSENQQQAADQVSIGNSIGSLRLLSAMDWRDFVETMSAVERILLEDPTNVYGRMDFATRDHYRHVVEKIARNSELSESAVARKAIELTRRNANGPEDEGRAAHVGFYLIDQGLPELEAAASIRRTPRERIGGIVRRFPLFVFLGSIGLLTGIFTAELVLKAHGDSRSGVFLTAVGTLSLLGASQLAVSLVNWMVTLMKTPHPLPRMDFSGAIPAESRTLVVVPTLIVSEQNVDDLIEALEVRFLANRDAQLFFGLLTDFADANEETTVDDVALLQRARNGIERVNQKYSGATGDSFFLFHRPRRWNPHDRIWMGYERKRGKLADLNWMLRHGVDDRFSLVVGDTRVLAGVRYVITLDSDTQLPRNSARQFVGTIAHPLNRARYSASLGRVYEGYGILQPRMAVSLPAASQSYYAQLCGSEPGIDPYTRAVSDVYQDLFGEGSFIGKGIYDVDAFAAALGGRFPENRILSHDLLEGCFARAGLVNDVQLYEEYPPRYDLDVSRQHRWIRGDWQIASWLFPRVRGLDGVKMPNPISALSRWKILDNLRRSLVSPALTFLLVLSWVALSDAWFWTLAVLGVILAPPLFASILTALSKPDEVLVKQHWLAVLRSAVRHFAQAVFRIACLPHEALFNLDAIVRTVVRMLVTHRRLLEWSASSEETRRTRGELAATLRSMWVGPMVALAVAAALIYLRSLALWVAIPVLLLWFAAPGIAWWISQSVPRRAVQLTTHQKLYLRKIARKTWAYFENFVGAEDNWLPPDNFQEHPEPVVAHRTSPTNMGLALLANLSAYDFGYLSVGQLLERTTHTVVTMQGLDRHLGHFFNWYDTQSLKPLVPRYVSSVDSGNLAGHVLTLRPGLLALPDDPIVAPRLFRGLAETFQIFMEEAGSTPPAERIALEHELELLADMPPPTLSQTHRVLDRVKSLLVQPAGDTSIPVENQAQWWARAMVRQCDGALQELKVFTPWIGTANASNLLSLFVELDQIPTLRQVASFDIDWLPALKAHMGQCAAGSASEDAIEWGRLLSAAAARATERLASIETLAEDVAEFAVLEYDFLYDRTRHLLAIGYSVDEVRRDISYYDLLASEARLCSFVAIAQRQLPQESWFALGRPCTSAGGEPILLSWSGSMFEYLMPMLVMPTYEKTLLDETCCAVVLRQIEYGHQRGVPWGISECGYNAVDTALNYQYRAFGVPGLGLKRGLADDLVIAPYASALALMITPEAACLNLQRLSVLGLEGQFGFYEAIDYTPARLPRGKLSAMVRSHMTHHQGMTLLSLAYLILDRPMQRRFESDPMFKATTLLLQERIPKTSNFHLHIAELSESSAVASGAEMPLRVLTSSDTPIPELKLLSNGRYHVMVTNAGGGYSRWKDLAVTRWREDATCDNWGSFCYIRDLATMEFWSSAHQPTVKRANSYEAMFSEGRAEYRRRDRDFDTHTEIAVSPEDDIELRRVRITNRSRARRTIDITSYAEVVLATQAADAMQPAFGNLFVQTEIIAARDAILCTRRARSVGEQVPWMFHLMAAHGVDAAEMSYETDRMQFVGRGLDLATPRAMRETGGLSGSQGSVLDPIASIRCRMTIEAEQSVTIDMVFGAAQTREACLGLVEKYHDRHLADRVFDLAWTHSGVILRQINAAASDAQLYDRLASSVIYSNASLRAEAGILLQNRRGQSGLWGYAISGDLPIVLLQIRDPSNINMVRQLVQAHAYWRLKGLAVDLVIWNEDHVGYRQRLQEQITALIATGVEANLVDRPGGIFVRSGEQISHEDRVLLQTVARAIFSDTRGTLAEQISRRTLVVKHVPRLAPTRVNQPVPEDTSTAIAPPLLLANGLGGFSADGREYVITVSSQQTTPAPWVNVLANSRFGTVISEAGPAYSWSENAHEFRLTPWSDDMVGASGGEAFYLRDEETGHYWSPTPLPRGGLSKYLVRHGFGYSVFAYAEVEIATELSVYVDPLEPLKFSVLKVRNDSSRTRRLSATGYVEWVLGDLRAKSAMHINTKIEPISGALFARNPYNTEFGGIIAFFDVDDPTRTLSGDRTEFLGRNGELRHPAAMMRSRLSGRVGPALDPCAAIQVPFELLPGQAREIIFRLGTGSDEDDARKRVQRFRRTGSAREALEKIRAYWERTLGTVQVETPDVSLNILANGWLVYQTLSCRLWARSGYYQSGGAFGFRDQLQDVMALVHAEPALVREHLLRCAARQFPEGDVQHWWHPPAGRGVRTRCSDDFLWLPLATCRYVAVTGDIGVLGVSIPFIEGRPLGPDEESYYDQPSQSGEAATLYEHCVRAVSHGLRFGAHGLPLMGSGDWNDGMNLVGIHGKGESVWLGFFLYRVLMRFADLARGHGDLPFAERCHTEAVQLSRNIDEHAWDGQWYRRAYFDDGSPLGSATNAECKIDSIAQSWSVLSGAANAQRSRAALDSVDQHLVDRQHALVELLEPAFDTSDLNPGYIRGYVPGVRENGGQYTHAAVWAAMAFAEMGDASRAWELLELINPLNHGKTAEGVATYKVEPYVVAADVYARAPHVGRGGWTWYTGSAGWMYRLVTESLLGLRVEADRLSVAPCIPTEWNSYTLHYRFRDTPYRVQILQVREDNARASYSLDDVVQTDPFVTLVDDHMEHLIVLRWPVGAKP